VSVESVVAAELAQPPPAAVLAFAASLAEPGQDAAIFFYGSTLRTGDLTGVMDFYRTTRRLHRRGLRGLVERVLWPEVSYREAQGLRAKVATMPLATFVRAAHGLTLDTTIWARFVQPVRLVWAADEDARLEAVRAVAAAVRTAARFAAALGPASGTAEAYWDALFRKTYAAEYRFETTDRAATVLAAGDAERWRALLPLAWAEAGVAFEAQGDTLRVLQRPRAGWALRDLAGKPLNLARIAKGAFTFDGAARYAAYKIGKHTGVEIEVTPFAERHPLLAAPGAWWKVRRGRARR
jgi:hypothetical protein